MSVYGFEIPHHKTKPTRDYVTVQVPFPPRKLGSIITPDLWREYGQSAVQAGIVRAMGPLAFKQKDENGFSMHEAGIGDWIIFRWGAGTFFQAGRGIYTGGGWRYVSTFNDVVATLNAADGPDLSTLEWKEGDDEQLGIVTPVQHQTNFDFDSTRATNGQ